MDDVLLHHVNTPEPQWVHYCPTVLETRASLATMPEKYTAWSLVSFIVVSWLFRLTAYVRFATNQDAG